MKELGGLMKQAKAMQEAMTRAQEEIQALEMVGEAGAGLVKVTLSGAGVVKAVAIDPSLMVEDERAVLEDLTVAAFNDAKRKLDEAVQSRMAEAAGPLASMMPPGMKMPF